MIPREAPLLELRDISRRFGATVALDGAAFAAWPGRVHALLGENGAGKTTLMRVAFGLVPPDAGEIRVDGRRISLSSPADAIRHGIGMVHQHFTLIPAMTVAENVALGTRSAWRFDRASVARAVAALASASGLSADPDAAVESLSIAEQQRVEILKALYRDARVLILDEPTGVLAPSEARDLLRWVREYVARGHAAILITHKLEEARAVADEITVLRHGRVVLTGEAPAYGVDDLAAAMLGERTTSARSAPPARTTDRPVVVRARGVFAGNERERIEDVSVELRGGEIVGVAAVEGAGHHVLLRVLARRVAPQRGTLELPPTIGFVPEHRHRDGVILDFSLAENVALRGLGSTRGRIRWDDVAARTRRLVEEYDVRGVGAGSDVGRVPLRALSGGNQQKLVLARELEGSPQLIVAENPTRGLDVRAAETIRARIRAAAAAGAAVVFHSADLDEVLELADWVLAVHGGQVRRCAAEADAVGRAMLGVA